MLNAYISAAQIPVQPANVTVTDVSSSSAAIQWTVRLITYTPEEYMIHYGLSQDMLHLTSTTVQGNMNVSVVYETHSLIVNDLLPETTYHFRVVARNAFGSARSGIGTFATLPKRQGKYSIKQAYYQWITYQERSASLGLTHGAIVSTCSS